MSRKITRFTRILAVVTGLGLTFSLPAAMPARAQSTDEVRALQAGLELMRDGDWDAAVATAGPRGSIAQDIILWHRLRASEGTFDETVSFLARRPGWPGLSLLRKRSEKTIPSDADTATVLDFFIAEAPQTGWGALRMAQALERAGATTEAQKVLLTAWNELTMEDEAEAEILTRYPSLLAGHHWKRTDMLLWRGQTEAAARLVPYLDAGHQALAKARIALREDKNGVDALIAAIPASLSDDPGLAYERFLWRASKGRNEDAIELALSRSGSAESLGKPEAWDNWRLVLARWAMRQDQMQTAYRLAANHHLTAGDTRNELDWLAGYTALRLGDAETALRHFQAFRIEVDSPISLGRGAYWEGRALEALGRGEEARQAYAFGAEHQTSFYGLLSAEKAGVAMDPALTGASDTFPDYRQAAFWNNDVMEAARLLWAADERYLTERFTVQLTESLDRTGIGQLTAWAEDAGAPHIQLMVAKYALRYHNILINRPYFPTPEIGRGNRTVPRALEMAIARRESEFDPEAISGVGARGLMQLMSGTAGDMADRIDMEYSQARLTSDMEYNTRLGSEYLAYLIEEFGNNPVLIAVAYNAGPGRARSWIEAYGDPRDPNVDIVDWIEGIPFNETMNYVMRVTESLPNYRARLTGKTEPIAFTQELKRR